MNGRKIKLTFIIVFISILVGFLIIIPIQIYLTELHKKEINRVISERGGVVVEIKKTRLEESPFDQAGGSNTIYRIKYKSKDGNILIAWYRASNVVNDIHSKPKYGNEEKWIFED